MNQHFISTAIPYVNAAPHIGFALELVIADALARHARRRGTQAYFLTGTDENSLKNALAAAAEGVPTATFVAAHAAEFAAAQANAEYRLRRLPAHERRSAPCAGRRRALERLRRERRRLSRAATKASIASAASNSLRRTSSSTAPASSTARRRNASPSETGSSG